MSPALLLLGAWLIASVVVAALVARMFAVGCTDPEHCHAATEGGEALPLERRPQLTAS